MKFLREDVEELTAEVAHNKDQIKKLRSAKDELQEVIDKLELKVRQSNRDKRLVEDQLEELQRHLASGDKRVADME